MKDQKDRLLIAGAGLAGAEAALTAASLGLPVTLIDMKPQERSPAHTSSHFAELVCSNSLKSNRPETAQGLLKRELKSLGSALLAIAERTAVPAGGSLAVDRDAFASAVSDAINQHPLIQVSCRTIESLEELFQESRVQLVATGPLTGGGLYESIQAFTGAEGLHFFDAVAPIVEASSIDSEQSFMASRYGKGGQDYLNCPMNREQYLAFRQALLEADRASVRDFDPTYFKDCQPIEVLAERGEDTMRFGPLRPVGLIDPATGKRPYACLQLRKEDQAGAMLSLVGCQTRLTFSEQRRVFGMIPTLTRAEFLRYGVMHRNSFLQGPLVLGPGFQSRTRRGLFFAGQLTGLEGYVEAIGSGLVAAFQAAALIKGLGASDMEALLPSPRTMIGALASWVTGGASLQDFQPMNANFGLLPLDGEGKKVKKADRALLRIQESDREMDRLRSLLKNYWEDRELMDDQA